MIIYNVTVNIDDEVRDKWLSYMKDVHIPDVMKTGCFVDYRIAKILTRQEDESGTGFSIQYRSNEMKDLNRYLENHAMELRGDVEKKFGGKFIAFRTILEEVE